MSSDLRRRFERLAVPLQEDLYRAARALASSDDDALDLVQETYYRAFRAFASYAELQQFKAWMYAILRNTHIDFVRRRRWAPISLDEAGTEPADPAPLPKDLVPEHVTAALGRLNPTHHLLLLLREVQGFSYREIAEILGCPVGSVMSGLHHARAALKKGLSAP